MTPYRALARVDGSGTRRLRSALLIVLAVAASVTSADDSITTWLALFRKHAEEYELAVDGASGKASARLVPDPILRWSQPVRIGEDGVVYLWVIDGRPTAAIAFFGFKGDDGSRSIVHETTSLATVPLAGEWRGSEVWHPATGGLEFRPVPDAPEPADTAAARLRQMQTLARDFSGATLRGGRRWNLRLLPKPLYRDEQPRPDRSDCALFALAQGTDPEALILFEARVRQKGEPPRWNYAVARFTDLEMHVTLKDREVFNCAYTVGAAGATYRARVAVKRMSDRPQDFLTP